MHCPWWCYMSHYVCNVNELSTICGHLELSSSAATAFPIMDSLPLLFCSSVAELVMKSDNIKTIDKLTSFFLIVDPQRIGVWKNGFRWRMKIVKEEWALAKKKPINKTTEGRKPLNDQSFDVPDTFIQSWRELSMYDLEKTLQS
uniref:Ovule protein n=1 Tax=Steinernema glaseri TaxID=37863 RepID=A0A1I7ZK32_9BILA